MTHSTRLRSEGGPLAHLLGYGAYLPYNRLKRSEIAEVLGGRGGHGQRTVASYDEDTTSMAVEAARLALQDAAGQPRPERIYFATTTPAYLDRTNANVIHAALGLDSAALTVDMAGSVRSGVGAVAAALDAVQPTLVVLSDIRTGLPGSADEHDGGDGAAALLFGGPQDGPVLADVLAVASATGEFLDRWRFSRTEFSGVGGTVQRARLWSVGPSRLRRRTEESRHYCRGRRPATCRGPVEPGHPPVRDTLGRQSRSCRR